MANPIMKRVELEVSATPMTVEGTVKKSAFLLALTAVSGLGFFFYVLAMQLSRAIVYPIAIGSMVAVLILGFVVAFKPHLAKSVAVPYAICEGLLVGGISLFAMSMYPTVPATALCATFVTASLMLGLYRTGVIKVTAKFRSIMTSAIFAIMILYVIQWVMTLAFKSSIPFLFDGGMIAIGFSLFVVVIASFSLLLDFDNIERGVEMGIGKEYEWVFSIGLLTTLVWMYIEFVRLLGYLED
ncbi:MAG: Bax inhibitor-1/YccA family protein [Moraxellaceae bacterium]|nr:Bax inhibitor-1/YccA family protein [Moraxellaceae bacterium]